MAKDEKKNKQNDKKNEDNSAMVENMEDAKRLGKEMEKMKTPSQLKEEGKRPSPEQ
jgi:hypothetical protein